MSVSLTLYPLRSSLYILREHVFVYNRLSFIDSYAIFGQIVDLSCYRSTERQDIPETPTITTHPLPPQTWIEMHTDDGIKCVREDARGEMTFAYAKDLKKLVIPPDTASINEAIKSFIDGLPDYTPIVLQWG